MVKLMVKRLNHGLFQPWVALKWVTSGAVAAAPMLRLAAEPMPITGFVEQRNCGSSLISSLCASGEEPNPPTKRSRKYRKNQKGGVAMLDGSMELV